MCEICDDEEMGHDDEPVALGPCCVCEGLANVRNVLMLHQKAPIPGRGWGCVVCGLPLDGALAVVCDACIGQPLRCACGGDPATDGRVPIDALTGVHDHDFGKHAADDYPMVAF